MKRFLTVCVAALALCALPDPAWAAEPPPPAPLPEAKRQIAIQALLLQLDWQKLNAAGIDLPKLVGRSAEASDSSPGPLLARVVQTAHAEEVVARLLDTKSATKLSRPQVMTLDGQPAQVRVGAETPVAIIQEWVNGKSRQRVESRETGEFVRLTPTILGDGQLVLAIDTESSRFVPTADGGSRQAKSSRFVPTADGGSQQAKQLPPTLRVRRFNLQIALEDGETAVLAELPSERQPAAQAEHGLMLVVTPKVLARTVPAVAVYPHPQSHVAQAGPPEGSPPQPIELAGSRIPDVPNRRPGRIELREGDVHVLPTKQLPARVHGFDPGILDVHVAGEDRALRLHAREKGVTSLQLDFGNGREPVTMEVFVAGDTRQLAAHLERLYPRADIEASEVGDSVVLRGSGVTAGQIRGIVEIAEQFYPRVLNQLEPAAAPAQAAQSTARIAWATAADDRVAALGRRLEHLRHAARSLESAGVNDMAGKIAAQADDVERELARITQPQQAPGTGRAGSQSADLHREIRELRGEVRELRRDVGRLIELLEKDPDGGAAASAGAADDADRDQAARQPQAAGDFATLSLYEKLYGIDFDAPGFEFKLPLGARRAAANLKAATLKIAQAKELFAQRRFAEAERLASEAFRVAPDHPAARDLYFKIRAAQEPDEKASPKVEPHGTDAGHGAEAKIRRRLDRPVSVSFDKVKLSDALKKIASTGDINVAIDQRGLEEEGESSGTVVSLHTVDEVSLRGALKLLLEPLGLGYRIEDEVLKVTSRQRVRGKPHVRNYAMSELLGGDAESGDSGARLEAFADLIAAVVEPETWGERGGIGSIRPYEANTSLVIRQTPDVHEEIADLLQMLRQFRSARAEGSAAEPEEELLGIPTQ